MVRRARKSGASAKDGKIDDLEANVYLERWRETQTAEKFIAKSGRPASKGRLLLIKNDFEGAKRQYRELLKATEKTGEVDRRFTAYTGIGLALEGSGEFAASAESFQKAIDTVEELRAKLSLHDRSEFYNVRIDGFLETTPYEGLARIQIKMNKPVRFAERNVGIHQSEIIRRRPFPSSRRSISRHSSRNHGAGPCSK